MTDAKQSMVQDKETDKRGMMLGCLVGQAVGDALGLGAEFLSKKMLKSYYPNGLYDYSQIVQDSYRSNWEIGEYTDDTDMAVCIMKSILECGQPDLKNIAFKFWEWFMNEPKDYGRTTRKVLTHPDYLREPFRVSEEYFNSSNSAANGALMRNAPVAFLPLSYSKDICRLTHWCPLCVDSCIIHSLMIKSLIEGECLPIEDFIDESEDEQVKIHLRRGYHSLEFLKLDEPKKTGYTLKALGAATWAYYHAKGFMSGLEAIILEGGDADTNGAIAGAILGARFGYDAIPNNLKDNLFDKDYIGLCEKYLDFVSKKYSGYSN